MSQAQVRETGYTARKQATSWRFVRGPGLAFWVSVIVCALANQACLVPQSVDPIVEAPHPPPRFDLGSIDVRLLAPVLQLYRQGSADAASTPPSHCELCLSIPFIVEDDPTITLEARWFVDYDLSVSGSQRIWIKQTLTGNFNTPDTVRALKPFEFDADALSVTNGVHVVEVVLAETAAFDDTSTTLRNRALNPGYSAAVYRFFVNLKVDQDASRPLCPSQFPSVKLPAGVCQ
jgi:hypothetical protein